MNEHSNANIRWLNYTIANVFLMHSWKLCIQDNYLPNQFDSQLTLYKKWSFPLRISLVNVTRFTISCGFARFYQGDDIYHFLAFTEEIFNGKIIFYAVEYIVSSPPKLWGWGEDFWSSTIFLRGGFNFLKLACIFVLSFSQFSKIV